MISPFVRLELNDKLWCEVGATSSTRAVLARRHFAGDGPIEVLSVEDDAPLSFQFPRRLFDGGAHHALSVLRPQMVARLVLWESKTTQIYRERRLRGPIVDGSTERGLVTCRFDALILDLAKCGPMREVVNGKSNFTFSLTDVDVEDIVTFIQGKANAMGMPWLAVGDIIPVYTFAAHSAESFTLERATPLAAVQQLVEQLRARNIPAEYALEQNGTTNYRLSIRSQVGSGITLAPYDLKAGQRGIRRTIDPTQQTTRAWVFGANNPDGVPGTGGNARFVVGNVTSNTFTLADRNGGAGPVAFDDQYATPAPAWHVYRVKTGETWPILGTTAGSPSTFHVGGTGSLVAGELMELRATEPLSNTRYLPWGTSGQQLIHPEIYEITAIDAINNRVTIALPWDNTTPLAVDGQHDGWIAKLHTLVGGPLRADSNAAGNYYGIVTGGVGAYQVDDWLIPATSTTAPYNAPFNHPFGTVSSIDSGSNLLHVTTRFGAADPCSLTTNWNGTRIYRPLREERVLSTLLASNELEFQNVAGLAVGDVLELYQPEGAGELPAYVQHPIYAQDPPTGFGIQSADVEEPLAAGVEEQGENPFCRIWTGGANDPPDGWVKSGAATITRTTDAAHVLFPGGKSIHLANWSSTSLQSERFFNSYAPGRDRVSLRAHLKFTTFSGDRGIILRIRECSPDGTPTGAVIAQTIVYAPDHSTAADEEKGVVGVYMALTLKGVTVLATQGKHGFRAELLGSGAVNNDPIAYVGGIDKWPHADVPATPLEFGDATRLVQKGNEHLTQWGYPVRFDLEAIALAESGRRLDQAIGGLVPFMNREYGINETQRLLRLETPLFHPERTVCTLARRSELLTDLVTV